MPITSGSFTKALWPGVNSWYGAAYDEHKTEYTDLFDTHTSRKAFEEDVGVTGFGLAQIKGEGGPVSYDSATQGFINRYQHVTYALGFVITQEMVDDDLYDVIGKKRAEALAFSMRQTKELVGVGVYNNAFTGGPTGGDGVSMLNASHPNVNGGTWSNILATAADISEASLEQACIDLMKYTNDRGLKIAVMPKSLIVPVDSVFEADRILKTEYSVGNANNDVNVIRSRFPGGAVVNHYLNVGSGAWFIRTNVKDGLKYFERKGDSFDTDGDFDTDNAKFKASGRYSFGWTDPRAIFGTPGA